LTSGWLCALLFMRHHSQISQKLRQNASRKGFEM
jgi:hypothetical protein